MVVLYRKEFLKESIGGKTFPFLKLGREEFKKF
jgi:hypothetical protein